MCFAKLYNKLDNNSHFTSETSEETDTLILTPEGLVLIHSKHVRSKIMDKGVYHGEGISIDKQ